MLSSFMLMSRILCSELWCGILSASFAFSHRERTMAPNESSVLALHTQEHLRRQKGRSRRWSDYAFYAFRFSPDLGERKPISLTEAGNEGTWALRGLRGQAAAAHRTLFLRAPQLAFLHGSWDVFHR